ncbi:MAG: SDR family oxidoreductase [Saprospiraceae bacterium]|nr:SDR family oxidoreductase [Saprospiraceae bacterium]
MSRTAIVTGGSKGIGKSICLAFAQAGYNIISCARQQADLDVLASEVEKHGVEISNMVADLSERQAIEDFGHFALEKSSSPNVLVNNTGVFLPGSLLSEDSENLPLMMHTNLYSAYYLSRIIVPSMVEQKSGHVFNICSVASIMAYPNGGSYSISKFALLGFSKVLREELKEKGVKVTSVLPGATWSNSWKGVDLPYERLMPAEDIAASICAAADTSPSTVIEEILIRPQLGDL